MPGPAAGRLARVVGLLLIPWLLAPLAARAANCTSIATGAWNAQATWGKAGAGCIGAPGGIPGTGDNVTIGNVAHTVTVTDNRNANTLQFATGNQVSGLTINGGVTLTVNGSMTVTGQNGGSGVRRVDVLAGGGLAVGNDLILVGGSNNSRDVELRLGDSASTFVTVANDLAGTAAGGNFSSANRVLITFAGQGTINVGRNLGGNSSLTSGDGTFVFNGAGAQVIGSYNTTTSNFNNITIAKTGGTATFAGNARIRGDLADNGNFDPASGNRTITFAGTALQNLAGSAAGTTFYRVTLINGNDLALAHDLTVTNLLTLTTGSIVTGPSTVFISNGSAISSAGGSDFVDGNLQKPFGAGANVSRVFEVGTVADDQYAPVTLVFASVSGAGNVTVASIDGDHPDIAASSIDETLSVNRYWRITNGGVAFTTYNATFTFGNPGDLDGGVDPAVFIAERRSPAAPAAGSWNATTVGSRTATTNQITGESGFDDFAVGTRVGVTPGIGRFNAYDTGTPAGQVTGVIQTKIAGVAFNVDLVAVNAAGNAIQTGYTNSVTVQLLDAVDDSGALDANACRASWTVIQTLSPDPAFTGGDNGRITIGVTEANAWRVARFRIVRGAREGCSTDAFAIRPNVLANLSARHADWENPGGASALGNTTFAPGDELHKAGRAFTVQADALNGAGSPLIATNYAGSATPALTACGAAACTPSFGNFALGAAFVAGQLVSNAATYDEVGAFNLQLVDTTFADIDSSDGTPADCSASGRHVCSSTVAVGRFVPDRFDVSYNMPVLETACGSGGTGFTYIGQAFNYILAPVISIVAREFGGEVTEHYAGALWRITGASLTGKAYSVAAGSLDTSGITGTDPVIADAGSGTGTLTFGSGGGLRFVRANPVAPFNAEISLAINVIDADGISFAGNPARFGQATAGNGIAFNDGKQMRYGRLDLANAAGSPALPLQLRLEAEYWNGSNFVTNTLDNCTAISANSVAMGGYTQSLAACDSSVTAGGFNAGRATLQLSAPGAANTGGVELRVNLDAAGSGTTCIAGAPTPVVGADLPHLQGNWGGGDFDENPSARATFGVYGGSSEVIHIRENFQ